MNTKLNYLNCPNCGAPITSKVCAYCGTTFVNYVDKDEELRELQYILRKKEINLAQMRQTQIIADSIIGGKYTVDSSGIPVYGPSNFIIQDINSIQLFNYRGYK